MPKETDEGLTKYGIDQSLVDSLVKEAGLTPEEAVAKVADGEGAETLKTARLKNARKEG